MLNKQINNNHYIYKSHYRYRQYIDWRYSYYCLPKTIDVQCNSCSSKFPFIPAEVKWYKKDELSGGLVTDPKPITGKFDGKGACSNCGKIFTSINWPSDAYYQVSIAKGNVWSWNREYVNILIAHLSNDKIKERKLTKNSRTDESTFIHYLDRLPKYVKIKNNRRLITKKFDLLLKHQQ